MNDDRVSLEDYSMLDRLSPVVCVGLWISAG